MYSHFPSYRCIMKMDHHCPWINSCVGYGNHAYFTRFLFFVPFGCIHAVIINSNFMYRLFTYVSTCICHHQYSPTSIIRTSIIGTCSSSMTALVRMRSGCGQGLLGVWRKVDQGTQHFYKLPLAKTDRFVNLYECC